MKPSKSFPVDDDLTNVDYDTVTQFSPSKNLLVLCGLREGNFEKPFFQGLTAFFTNESTCLITIGLDPISFRNMLLLITTTASLLDDVKQISFASEFTFCGYDTISRSSCTMVAILGSVPGLFSGGNRWSYTTYG